MVEVENFLKKSLFIIDLGRIKTNNKRQMLLKGGGGCNPLNPSPGSASEYSPVWPDDFTIL